MDFYLPFIFRSRARTCTAFIDASQYPCYVFTIQHDVEIIQEFGDEISVKTDGEMLLPKEDDFPQLVAIRQAIFDSVSQYPSFLSVKTQLKKPRSCKYYYSSNDL